MDLRNALAQLAEIQGVISRSEIFRGYRPRTMAMTGGLAIGAGLLQLRLLPELSPDGFIIFWTSIAAACLLLVGSEIAVDYWTGYGNPQKRMARKVINQFAPSLAAGALLTIPLTQHVGWLPGLWSLVFGLGVFAARPYLPRGIGWVALFYVSAGLLLLGPTGQTLGSLAMVASFGFGQLFMAWVLFWNLERRGD